MREIRKESKVCCVSWSDQAAGKCFERSRNLWGEGGGGGRVLQFKVTGMIEWGQKLKPKKRPEKKKTMPNFQAIKIPKSIKINTDITITNLQIVLNTTKNPFLHQTAQKILAKIFLPQKIPEIKYFKPPKLLQSSLSLEIRSTPPGLDTVK